MGKQTRIYQHHFRGSQAPPAVASRMGDFCSLLVLTGGTPTCAAVSGGSMDLALEATNEVQSVTLYQGDILPYDIDDIIRVSFLAKVTASLAAAVTAVFGLAGAQHATPDTVAQNAWFRLQGSNALLVETDDGTTDNDDVATGITLGTTYRRCVIEFATGVKTLAPPSLSLGGKAAMQFYVSDDFGSLRRVAKATAFDMSAYAGNLQLFAQIQKTAGTAVGTLSIAEIEVEVKLGA